MARPPRTLARQITVISATCFMIVAAMAGGGAFGGQSVSELQDGALSTSGSILAPGGPAFAIWTVIYIGLIAYAVWQALPSQSSSPIQASVGWWIALSAVVNGLWLVSARWTTLPVTVVVILTLAAILSIIFRILVLAPRDREPGPRWVSAVLLDGVTGLHLGWVTVASVTNVAAWLTRTVPSSWGEAASTIGVIVLVVVAAIGVGIALRGRGRMAPALAMAWGLSWVGVERLAGEPKSAPVAFTACAVAVVILVAAVDQRFLAPRRRGSDSVRSRLA